MTDQLREALETLDAKSNTWWGTEIEPWTLPIIDAARKWLEVKESEPIFWCRVEDRPSAPFRCRTHGDCGWVVLMPKVVSDD